MKYDVEIHRRSFYDSSNTDVKHFEVEADSQEDAQKEADKIAIRVEILSSTKLITDVIVVSKQSKVSE